MLQKMTEKQAAREEADAKKKKTAQQKERISDQFRICQEACDRTGECIVKSYKQCLKCLDLMKAVCSKKKCRDEDGSKPAMILPNIASLSRSLPVKHGTKTRDEDDLCSDISGFRALSKTRILILILLSCLLARSMAALMTPLWYKTRL